MTSPNPIEAAQHHLEGRSVRDVVEYSPEQVDEPWCRKILRQILQSLELQYAMRMPHRAITPDTIVFHENGEPLLVPVELGQPAAREADDLTALARIIHYAITHELAPTGPLRGRADGYSESLVAAVDACMDPDPARRPQTIAALRDLLGIVALGPATAAVAARTPAAPSSPEPASRPGPEPVVPKRAAAPAGTPSLDVLPAAAPRRGLVLNRWQRWAVGIGGGAVLLAIALALFAELRDSGSYDHIVLTLPQTADHPDTPPAAPAPAAAPQRDAATAAAPPAAPDANGAPAGAMTAPLPDVDLSAPPRARRFDDPLPAARPTPAAGVAYQVRIEPWGIVYIDGVDRGVSPPVKRLVLAPGRHAIRVTNPNFHDRVLEVDGNAADGEIAVDFGAEPQ